MESQIRIFGLKCEESVYDYRFFFKQQVFGDFKIVIYVLRP
jgi:hypothetical protein